MYGQDLTKKELYSPSPKYGNFKEEMFEYPTMSKCHYERLRVKVAEFMKRSEKVKALRAFIGQKGWGWEKHYGIPEGAPVGEEHLFAVILYCDYSVICTKISGIPFCLYVERVLT